MAAILKFTLLGTVSIEKDTETLSGIRSRTAEALLIYLASHDHPFTRQFLAEFLWHERSPQQAAANLRAVLNMLRKVVGEQLDINRQTVQFKQDQRHEIDALTFEQRLKSLLPLVENVASVDTEKIEALQDTMQLYKGSFLEGFNLRESYRFDEWVLLQREKLRHLAARGYRTLAYIALRSGAFQDGLLYATELVALDPFDEASHRLSMWLHARAGQRNAALLRYRELERLLDVELGVEPAGSTKALVERLRYLHFPPPVKLPRAVNSFVGRQNDLATIIQRLPQSTTRLLSLLGPGGIGKSRLAAEIARQIADKQPGQFLDGIYFVPLAGVESATLLSATVIDLLELPPNYAPSIDNRLFDALASKEMLLILDNMEHLLNQPATLTWLAQLLDNAPNVTVIATSRERLRLVEERVYFLEGLLSGESDEATQLFIQRAQRILPSIQLDDASMTQISTICQLLAGSPLGIELAAAWVQSHALDEIGRMIQTKLDFLSSSFHNVAPRHQSMQAVFDESWRLLTAEEQQVSRQLAVFAGPFSYEAFESIVDTSRTIIDQLVDKSLMTITIEGWLSVHPLLRQYLQRQLALQPALMEAVATRHARYFSQQINASSSQLFRQRRAAVAAIQPILDDAHAAWKWAVDAADLSILASLYRSLYFYYHDRNWYEQTHDRFFQALSVTQKIETAPARTLSLQLEIAIVESIHDRGEYERARQMLANIMPRCRDLGAARPLAHALIANGDALTMLGELRQAESSYKEGLAFAAQEDAHYLQLRALINLANIAMDEYEDLDRSQQLYEEGLALALADGDRNMEAAILVNLGAMCSVSNQLAEAHAYLQRGLTLYQEEGVERGAAVALNNLSQVSLQLDKFEPALTYIDQSIDINRRFVDRRSLASALRQRGAVLTASQAFDEARLAYREALELAARLDAAPLTVELISEIGALLGQQGEPARGLALIAFAQSAGEFGQELDQIMENHFQLVSASMKPDEIERCRQNGLSMGLDVVVATLLVELKRPLA